MEIGGSRILVTGASSGIGAALAVQLAARGATVGLVARRADRLDEVLARCRAHTEGSRAWTKDLADPAGAARLALEVWDAFGALDCLVNNAGVPMRRHTTELDAETLDWVMRVNFFAPAQMTLALLPRMLERGSGMIVNVASVAGRLGNAHEAAYSASKAALCAWSEATAVDLWDTPVAVRLVNPGSVATEIWDLPGNDAPLYDGPMISADEEAEGIIGAMEGDRFETYVPDMREVITAKDADPDAFLAGMADWVRTKRA